MTPAPQEEIHQVLEYDIELDIANQRHRTLCSDIELAYGGKRLEGITRIRITAKVCPGQDPAALKALLTDLRELGIDILPRVVR